MKCEDIQKRLKAFLSNDMEDHDKKEIQDHLDSCPACMRYHQQLRKLSAVIQTWKGIEPSPHLFESIKSRAEKNESLSGRIFTYAFLKKTALRLAQVSAIVVLTLLVSHWLQKPVPSTQDDLNTINLYLTEHQEAILQTVSEEIGPQTETRISVHQEDIFYYEHFDGFPRFGRPGVILRGPESQRKIDLPEAPTISKGKILTLTQAQKAVDFDLVTPLRLHPGYILDSIRKIEDFNSLHLIYTNGINTISLFEQPINGERGLAAQDFREYAVYRSIEPFSDEVKAQDKATILAWRNGNVSFVLIGNIDMPHLMDVAQAINSANRINYEKYE